MPEYRYVLENGAIRPIDYKEQDEGRSRICGTCEHAIDVWITKDNLEECTLWCKECNFQIYMSSTCDNWEVREPCRTRFEELVKVRK